MPRKYTISFHYTTVTKSNGIKLNINKTLMNSKLRQTYCIRVDYNGDANVPRDAVICINLIRLLFYGEGIFLFRLIIIIKK